MPSYSNRQMQILSRVRNKGSYAIEALSQDFQVSSQTIRRDVNQLCEMGELRRIRGGVTLPPNRPNIANGLLAQTGWEEQSCLSVSTATQYAKGQSTSQYAPQSAIVKQLSALIPDGASLAIPSAPRMMDLVRALQAKKGLKIVTNDLAIALNASRQPGWQVTISGGAVQMAEPHDESQASNTESRAVNGPRVAEFFGRFEMDFALVQAAAMSDQGHILECGEEEAEIVRVALANARQSLLILPSDVQDPKAHVRAAHLDQIDHVIDEQSHSETAQDAPSRKGTEQIPATLQHFV